MSGLDGARVALLETRMSAEAAALVRRNGGEPYCVQAVRESVVDCAEDAAALIDNLAGGLCGIVVFTTGVGVEALCREAERQKRLESLLESLRRVTMVCRGPKPAGALMRRGVRVSIAIAEPYTTAELLDALSGLDVAHKGVAVVHYGERSASLAESLLSRGARLQELCLYEWRMPEDTGPLRELVSEIIAGRVDAVAFTSQAQARHLFRVAEETAQADALAQALNTRTVVAAVGPTCAAALKKLAVTPRVVPEHPKMGHMVVALARYIEQHPL
ncbi:MAG: uroporphyrinogen-III synthase, partial [Dehalococcoidia bacterium]|nr:uroporphyrinogen-III synthase [Dehalococcoidia bacterium]